MTWLTIRFKATFEDDCWKKEKKKCRFDLVREGAFLLLYAELCDATSLVDPKARVESLLKSTIDPTMENKSGDPCLCSCCDEVSVPGPVVQGLWHYSPIPLR